jgi:acyl carrier protein
MDDEEVFDAVRGAIMWAKAEAVTLTPAQITRASLLAEPPIFLDSLEFVAMVTRLEDVLGLIIEDVHFAPGSMRTVGDVVAGVTSWIGIAETTWN